LRGAASSRWARIVITGQKHHERRGCPDARETLPVVAELPFRRFVDKGGAEAID